MNDQELYYTVYVDDDGIPSVTMYDSIGDAITNFLLEISHDTPNPFELIKPDEGLNPIIQEGIYFFKDMHGSVSWGKAERRAGLKRFRKYARGDI